MATWGGSTVDNLESITEDGGGDQQDNEDEDDDGMYHLSHDVRKSVLGVSDQVQNKPVFIFTEEG